MRFIHFLKKEIIHLTPVIVYFFICFSLVFSAQTLLLQPGDIHYMSYVSAVIGAIFAGKVILITENLKFVNSFSNKPLIYNIPWKFFIYAFFVILLQIVEHLLRKFFASGNLDASYLQMLGEIHRPMFWGLQILILIIFFIFTVFSELAKVIGGKKIKRIFFG
ncbi:MAG: hypothetical protein WC748_03380 [Legionellales bacterium]|jgi:hypothetical protein